jgi:hypothetical protein
MPDLKRDRRRTEAPGKALRKVVYELGAIGAEMVAIPLRAWMRAAEAAGALVLSAYRLSRPRFFAALRALRAAVRFLERVVTPARATTLVALCAAAVLAGSQFTDYRAVDVGSTQYQGVGDVAPAPEVAKRDPRTAHGDWLIAVAAAAALLVLASYGGRWRLARLLFPLGLIALAVALLHDHDAGLNAGSAGNAYEGAKAVLLDGYRTEIVAAIVLALTGPLLSRSLRLQAAARPERTRSRRRSSRRGNAGRSRAIGAAG